MGDTSQVINFRIYQPRRNLPLATSRRRGESNFVAAFADAYIASISPYGVGGREFGLEGFGIADFVWIAWRNQEDPSEASALSLEGIKTELFKHRLSAFEMKLSDWRKGLMQAYRYSYFADRVIVVVPPKTGAVARRELSLFKELGVGLWSFDAESGKVTRHFTPRAVRPKNQMIRSRAVALLSRRIYFRQRRKMGQARL